MSDKQNTSYDHFKYMYALKQLCLYILSNISFILILTAVDSGYTGPRLDGDISAGFMNDLLAWMKDQKILHKKYAFKVCTHLITKTRKNKYFFIDYSLMCRLF